MSPPSGTVETGSAMLAYDEDGQGEAVVLVHSGITDRRMWEPQFRALADQFRVVRYDLQGYGESRAVSEGTNREELVALLDALDIGRAHLAGSSFGAGIALDATLEQPDRFRSLTLVGPTVGGHEFEDPDDDPVWDEVEARYEASVTAFEAGDYAAAAAHEVTLWVVGPGRDPGDVDPGVRRWVAEMNEAALRNEVAGRQRPDATALSPPAIDRLDELSVPVHVVLGAYDLPHIGDAARTLVERVPGARLSVVPDAGHLPSVERPETVTDLLVAFWEDHSEGET